MPPSSGKSAINVQARTGPTPGIDVSSRYRCASVASVVTISTKRLSSSSMSAASLAIRRRERRCNKDAEHGGEARAIDEEMCQAHVADSDLALASGLGVMDRAVLWRDFCSWCRVRNALDDDLIVRREAGPDHAQAAAKIADLDLLGHNRAVRRDGHDEVLRLVREYGRVRHEEGRHRSADDQPDPGEHARSQQTVRIRNGGSGVDRTARPVERIVHEIKSALPGELCFVAERDLNLDGKASFEPRRVARKGQE